MTLPAGIRTVLGGGDLALFFSFCLGGGGGDNIHNFSPQTLLSDNFPGLLH